MQYNVSYVDMIKRLIFSVILLIPVSSLANVVVPNATPPALAEVAAADFDKIESVPIHRPEPGVMYQHLKSDAHVKYDEPGDTGGMISVSLSDPKDLNWGAAYELSDPSLRFEPIVLPFLNEYPIENIEVKFRILNKKF